MLDKLFGRRPSTVAPEAECFRRFFEATFGPPTRFLTIYREESVPTIDIGTYRAPWDGKVSVIASVGLSFFTGTHSERAEMVLLVDNEVKVAERAFARIVSLLAENPRAFGVGEFYEGPKSFGAIARDTGRSRWCSWPSRLRSRLFSTSNATAERDTFSCSSR